MFGLFILMLFGLICSAVWTFFVFSGRESNTMKLLASICTAVCLTLSIVLFFTPQTQMYWIKFTAGAKKGTWLVVDNSGGKTLRHWVLYNNYVKGCDQTDGWEFYAESCAPCYVGGDSFVGKITKEQIEGDKYKKQFNIPEDNIALH